MFEIQAVIERIVVTEKGTQLTLDVSSPDLSVIADHIGQEMTMKFYPKQMELFPDSQQGNQAEQGKGSDAVPETPLEEALPEEAPPPKKSVKKKGTATLSQATH